jgi:hypothetical protein
VYYTAIEYLQCTCGRFGSGLHCGISLAKEMIKYIRI